MFEGEGTTKTKIDTKCGTAQDTLDLTASVITIHYNTDMKFTDIGFTATWDASKMIFQSNFGVNAVRTKSYMQIIS